MKTNIMTLTGALMILASCGSASQYASSQEFQDGFYSRPAETETRAAVQASRSKVNDLVKETESSQLFLKAGQTDTLFVPENMSTTLKFNKQDNATTVTVTNSPSYSLYPDGYADGFAAGFASSYWPGSYWRYPYYSSWYWGANPWYYSGIWWDRWYWSDPWYSSWYWNDPWYWGRPGYYWSWYYDPWYHDPWYHHHYHHHHHWCGDYYYGHGGRDVYWGDRGSTTGNRRGDVMGVTSSNVRRNTGTMTSSGVRRTTATASASGTRANASTLSPVRRYRQRTPHRHARRHRVRQRPTAVPAMS